MSGRRPKSHHADNVKIKSNGSEPYLSYPRQMTTTIRLLIADKILPRLEGKTCPRCSEGVLSKLYADEKRKNVLKHRCNNKHCQARINPHHLHPLFTEGQRPQKQSLRMQSAVLLLKLLNVPQSVIRLAMGTKHKALEDLETGCL